MNEIKEKETTAVTAGIPASEAAATHLWLRISLSVMLALLIALIGLSVCYAISLHNLHQTIQTGISAADDLQSQLDAAREQAASDAARLEEQQNKINEQQGQLDQQQNSINELNRQLMIKQNYTDRKIVALTFDDGPGPYTARLLDALRERGAHATFFVVGYEASRYPELLQRMEAEGHAVGNHSQSHRNLSRWSVEQIRADMEACANTIRAAIGHDPVALRCPGGNNSANAAAYAQSVGLPIIQWSVDTRDWQSRNADKIIEKAFQSGKYGIQDGAIVLMHDIYETSVDAAIRMVDQLQQQGYVTVTVPELLQARPKQQPTTIVYSCIA